MRALHPAGAFTEVFVTAPVETLRQRDVKGLYAAEAAQESVRLTGVSAPYEAPDAADLTLDTSAVALEAAVEQVLAQVRRAAPRTTG